MTYARREEIFSKEVITVAELQEIMNFTNRTQASQKLNEIKRVVGDRLGIEGKLHTEDYFEFFNIKTDRYKKLEL
jgi:hypothetical protein